MKNQGLICYSDNLTDYQIKTINTMYHAQRVKDMKDFEPQQPQDSKTIAAEQRQIKAEKHRSSRPMRPGHTMFEFDLTTGEIQPAKLESVEAHANYILKGQMAPKITIHKKVIIRDNCLYRAALNKPNAIKKLIPLYEQMVANGTIVREVVTVPSYTCPACNGDGKATCSNPDHGFISGIGGEISRLGCPCCGHDENHKIPNGGPCDDCGGKGAVNADQCQSILEAWEIDQPIEDYLIQEVVSE